MNHQLLYGLIVFSILIGGTSFPLSERKKAISVSVCNNSLLLERTTSYVLRRGERELFLNHENLAGPIRITPKTNLTRIIDSLFQEKEIQQKLDTYWSEYHQKIKKNYYFPEKLDQIKEYAQKQYGLMVQCRRQLESIVNPEE